MENFYTEDYYKELKEGLRESAREIVPLILELVQPKSVIDVGCGLGTWLSVFEEFGIRDYLGIDGDYINTDKLEIPQDQFTPFNLTHPLRLNRKFDLVVSLEVAEHLPIECAETFVDSLTHLGPVILFSAALPFQGGTSHLNEQWPDYWAKHFQNKEYLVIDCLRRKLWRNDNIKWWYIQNILLFVRKECLKDYPSLKRGYENTALDQLSIVHPKLYLTRIIDLQERVEKLNQWGTDLQKQVENLQEWWSKLEEQVLELEKQIAELQELKPGRIALRNVLRALPALTKHALYAKINRFLSNINSRS